METTRILVDLQNCRFLTGGGTVLPEWSLLVAAETLAAMFRGVVRLEADRDFSAEELRTLQAIDTLGREMRS